MTVDAAATAAHVDRAWDTHIVETLHDYIRIPNVSSAYDSHWAEAGHMARATELLRQWCEHQVSDSLRGATVEVQQLPGRTPLLIVDIPATASAGAANTTTAATHDQTVILYGHLDKQPPFDGWRPGLGPWEPVVEGDRLYGRGGADDGYSVFAALTAVAAVRAAGGAHARCLVLIEASEESGSPDLDAHIDQLGPRLGSPSLVVCLDSGCANWDRLWVTTSLRGMVGLAVRVEILTEGVHSGKAGGIVPSTFRIMRRLLDRVEDPDTGALLPPALHVDIPEVRRSQAADTAAELGDPGAEFPYVAGARSADGTGQELLLARTWEPTMEVTGLDGAPPPANAGNVLRPFTEAKLSFRLPPTAAAAAAAKTLVALLSEDPPYGAAVTVTPSGVDDGWHAPPESPWLSTAVDAASTAAFGQPARALGRRWLDPVHGHAGTHVPRRRVRGDRRPRPEHQRPRPQRVPPPADGPEGHHRGRPPARRPRPRPPLAPRPPWTGATPGAF